MTITICPSKTKMAKYDDPISTPPATSPDISFNDDLMKSVWSHSDKHPLYPHTSLP